MNFVKFNPSYHISGHIITTADPRNFFVKLQNTSIQNTSTKHLNFIKISNNVFKKNEFEFIRYRSTACGKLLNYEGAHRDEYININLCQNID